MVVGQDARVGGSRLSPAVSALWSHRCGWDELTVPSARLPDGRAALVLGRDLTRRWTVSWRYAGDEVSAAVRDLTSMPATGCEPVRRFSWRRRQRHRPGLQFLVSTGRHHGFESLAEAQPLLALDFAGGLVDVLAQPLRLRYVTPEGTRVHIPEFLAVTRAGRWLIDVRPADRVGGDDLVAFAATAEVALVLGWRYTVVTGWQPHVATTLDALSGQRRSLTDPLNLIPDLLAAVADRPCRFTDLAQGTVAPAVARAMLLHLLWRRRLGIDLRHPLRDATLVHPGQELP